MTALAPLLGLIVLCPLTAAAQNFDPQAPPPAAQPPPVSDSRFQQYLSASVFSPLFYIKASSSGVLDQINKMPVEWTGIAGFSRRTTSRVGQALAGETIRHSAAAVLRHRVEYDACASCANGWKRTTHAMSRAFVAVHDNGRLAPNYSLLASKYGPATLANAWYPSSYTAGDTVRSATVAVGAAALSNIVHEFTPDLKRLAHIR